MKNFMIILIIIPLLTSCYSIAHVEKSVVHATAVNKSPVIKEQTSQLAELISNHINTVKTSDGTYAMVIETFSDGATSFEIAPKKNGKNIEIEIKEVSALYYFWVNVDGYCSLYNEEEEEIASYDPDYQDDPEVSYNVEQIYNLLSKHYMTINNYYNNTN